MASLPVITAVLPVKSTPRRACRAVELDPSAMLVRVTAMHLLRDKRGKRKIGQTVQLSCNAYKKV